MMLLDSTWILHWLERLADIFTGVLLVFLPIELWKDARKGQLTRQRFGEMVANVLPLLPMLALYSTYTAVGLWLFEMVRPWAVFHFETTPASAFAALVLVDFAYYWEHRFEHRVRAIWALTHSVHHSSPLFNQTTALRISAFDGYVTPWFYLPIALLGFEPLLVAACIGLTVAYQQWIHTESIGSLGWFDRWFNSPSNHRVHHGCQRQYLDKNFGGILVVWDRVFGTYVKEGEPVVYD
jgi:sterol desaturase/sphingolipid hydroxylase (fatty acid hydroxylase superfamily)